MTDIVERALAWLEGIGESSDVPKMLDELVEEVERLREDLGGFNRAVGYLEKIADMTGADRYVAGVEAVVAERDALRAEIDSLSQKLMFAQDSLGLNQSLVRDAGRDRRELLGELHLFKSVVGKLMDGSGVAYDRWAQGEWLVAERDHQLDAVRAALAGHPKCEEHPDGDVIKCGWKRAVLDVQHALDGES